MKFNYLYGKQADKFSYVNIPKLLITEGAFSEVSLEAKMLYGLILERMSSYEENHWQDEKGHVYVIYPEKEIMEDMNCSEAGAAKYLSELENSGLLERKIGKGNAPTRLYLKRLEYIRKEES